MKCIVYQFTDTSTIKSIKIEDDKVIETLQELAKWTNTLLLAVLDLPEITKDRKQIMYDIATTNRVKYKSIENTILGGNIITYLTIIDNDPNFKLDKITLRS